MLAKTFICKKRAASAQQQDKHAKCKHNAVSAANATSDILLTIIIIHSFYLHFSIYCFYVVVASIEPSNSQVVVPIVKQ